MFLTVDLENVFNSCLTRTRWHRHRHQVLRRCPTRSSVHRGPRRERVGTRIGSSLRCSVLSRRDWCQQEALWRHCLEGVFGAPERWVQVPGAGQVGCPRVGGPSWHNRRQKDSCHVHPRKNVSMTSRQTHRRHAFPSCSTRSPGSSGTSGWPTCTRSWIQTDIFVRAKSKRTLLKVSEEEATPWRVWKNWTRQGKAGCRENEAWRCCETPGWERQVPPDRVVLVCPGRTGRHRWTEQRLPPPRPLEPKFCYEFCLLFNPWLFYKIQRKRETTLSTVSRGSVYHNG